MRAVFDTNVVVSALIWSGAPFRLLEIAAEGNVELITSPSLIAELTEVLGRANLATKLRGVRGSIEDAIALYGSLTISVTPDAVPRIVPNDRDDDHVIAAAVAGQVDIIVSGDKHLLELATYGAIRIVAPAEALALMV